MTPEQQAAELLAATTRLSQLTTDPRLLYGALAGAAALAFVVRPSPRRPSPAEHGGSAPGTTTGRTQWWGDREERVASRAEPPPKRWAVEGLVPHGPRRPWWAVWRPRRGYVTTVLGAGGVGKSYVLLDLGIAALTGEAWLGQDVGRVRSVLYVDTELDVEECRRRAYPLARGRGHGAPPKGLHYLHLRHSLAALEGQALVAQVGARVRAGLILVDSLTIGSLGAPLNDPGVWNRILGGMEGWGAPVVCIDHQGKDAARGAVGSFMKQAKVRSVLQLALKGGTIQVAHTKSNFGPMRPPFAVAAQRLGPPDAPTCVRYEPVGAAALFYASPPGSDPEEARKRAGALPSSPAVPPPSPEDTADGAPVPLPLPLPARPALPLPGRDEPCRAIYAWLQAQPAREWARAELYKAVAANPQMPVKAHGPVYAHLKHLEADGWLVGEDKALRVAHPGGVQKEAEA